MEPNCTSEFDSPLSYRYDESDSMLLCQEVKVPWERVFVHGDALLSRDIYITTPSHCFGNHQSNVRYWSKMRLLVGLCSRIANATGADQVPAVRETLGKMSSYEGMIAGMVNGQINALEDWPGDGYVCFNRRMMYAALEWCTQNYSQFVDELRDVLADAAMRRHHPHEAVQAGLGHGGFRIRRPASAIREILCRRAVHRAQPRIPRDRLGRVQQGGRGSDGELRLPGGRRQESSGLAPASFDVASV
jgi:hypothetical protein